ncbi:hypothetical protein [Trinickia sp. EG282A]|uniref:hypothetical protein n=1 Tax=Trinickia sp. EG282A TaxID=3237013 RepID=UPI0034D2C769
MRELMVIVWVLAAASIAASIAIDMRHLAANRVWLSRSGWTFACICSGPVAGVVYLMFRRAARRALIASVWQIVGGDSYPSHTRRKRLVTLLQSGLIGTSVFKACLKVLDDECTTLHDSNNVE